MNKYNFGFNVRYCVLRSALNRVLILAQECRGKMVQNRTGIMDYKTKVTFWWQNNEKLEIRFQCKVLSVKRTLSRPAGAFFLEYFIKGVEP